MLELEDFDQYLRSLEECGECILIGGQAVNFWAERYRGKDEDLGKLMPYTLRTVMSMCLPKHGRRSKLGTRVRD